ncbi:MAG TPA: UDP-N-acetylmuramoyl-L-alanine--D-glutamate ligase [Rhizorhapis sp.]|nr:UDP-N-acetylmuramoyl-L-alanine--D-glutamate ligase [Rhizorhapis sp.]
MIVSPAFSDRKYAVLGLARSGLATIASLVKSGAHVVAWDSREEAREAALETVEAIRSSRAQSRDVGVTQGVSTSLDTNGSFLLADPLLIDLAGFDGVVVSPGVPLNRHPIADKAGAAAVPVIGDIELFALARPSLPAHRVVGITGTNGKSTTTALIHHLVDTAAIPTRMGGNIGLPILGQDPLPEGGVYVLELSSYQIDLTYSLDADVAVLLNITPDHLDRYDGFAGYCASKARLFAMQSADHVAVIAVEDEPSRQIAASVPSRLVEVHSGQIGPGDQARWPSLQGPHNAQNAAVAIAVARALALGEDTIAAGLRSYASLPHRMQRVAEKNGVLFVNDSKATNPASTAPALAAYPPKDGRPRIHWIVGGLAKSDDLDDCAPHFGNVKQAYTIGEAGPRFAEILSPVMPVDDSELLITAVRRAARMAEPGDVVLLSPACASFDQFRDFEARGDAFRAAVEALG